MKCEYHDRLEEKIDNLCELTRETREDVAFLRGRVKESGLAFKIFGVLTGVLVVLGGAIAWFMTRAS